MQRNTRYITLEQDPAAANSERRGKSLLSALSLALPLVLWPHATSATVLIFDQARNATGTTVQPTTAGADLPQDYGDRVSGAAVAVPGGFFSYGNGGEGFTPDVTVEYLASAGVNLWTQQYGDLINVAFAAAPLSGAVAGSLTVAFSADPGYQVQLYGFDLAGWANADYTINSVNVLGDGGTLYSLFDAKIEGDFNGFRHTTFDFGNDPLTAAQLAIEIDFGNLPASQQDNIGIDNIRFGQIPPAAIPIPAAYFLFATALAGVFSVGRRA